MNSEETELTFIRCPSCRSLVPAVATRCRMCGHYFEGESADGAGESGDLAKRKSRVRQRTISVSKDEIDDAVQQEAPIDSLSDHFEETDYLTSAPVKEEAPASIEAQPEPWEGALRESVVEHEPEEPPEAVIPPVSRIEPAEEHHLWENRVFPETAHTEPEENAADEAESDLAEEDEDDLFEEEEGEDLNEAAPVSAVEETKPAGKKRRRRRRKRRHGGGEQQNAAGTMHNAPTAHNVVIGQDAGAGQTATMHDAPTAHNVVIGQNAAMAMTAEDYRETTVEPKRENVMASQESNVHENVFGRGGDSRSQGGPDFAEAGVSAQEEGTLLGWFVNYEQDSRGVGGELRTGRFFIGRQRLRKNDMVIPDSAISTPHCLIAASRAEGLKIQDLMSEQGTFIKRRGKDSFVQVRDVVTVEHGDSLRFGGYEVLVCLVPGRK